MKRMLIALGALLIASAASASEDRATVDVWTVDYTGKPPFKRTLEQLPVSDVARFEAVQETVAVMVKQGNRPPFKRRVVELPVSDIAQFESADSEAKTTRYRGRTPFKRY